MYVITSKGIAILLMIISLTFLGTWPALLCLLERRGRKPQHTFLEFSFASFVVAIIVAMTLGDIGHSTPETPNFADQLSQDNGPSVGYALAGGVFLMLGNLATQYSLAYLGVSLTQVIASSCTVVVGTTLNYFLDDRINKAYILFPGVACFLFAVVTGSFTHHSVKADTARKLTAAEGASRPGDSEAGDLTAEKLDLKSLPSTVSAVSAGDLTASFGSAEYINAIENQRAMKTGSAKWSVGLCVVAVAGGSLALFSPAFNLATNDQWNNLKPGVPKLVIYTAFFWFSLSFCSVSWIMNLTLLYFPILGAPRSSIREWLGDWKGRHIALAAGVLCGLGNGLQFMAGQAAGYAAADAVQALPLVSTFWGVILFGEYRRSSTKTYTLLAVMLLLFAVAVALLCASAGTRKN